MNNTRLVELLVNSLNYLATNDTDNLAYACIEIGLTSQELSYLGFDDDFLIDEIQDILANKN